MSRRFQQYSREDEPIPGYRLIQFLGKGNFGEVWMASAPGNTKVALKIIDIRGREGLIESRAIERIKDITHPHLTAIYAFWLVNSNGEVVDDISINKLTVMQVGNADKSKKISGTVYFNPSGTELKPVALIVAMALGAKNLADLEEEYRRDNKAIPLENLLDFMEDASKGLDYLNSPIHDHDGGRKPIIHGDIKPQNMLIVGNSLQICDFGLAREIDDVRKTATAMGTYAYAAPELLAGKPHIRSDQYCLAISYIELRTGALPLYGETNLLKIAELHRDGKLDLSGLGNREAVVLRKATAPDPEGRYVTCREFVRALRRAVELDSDGSASSDSLRKTTPIGPAADTVAGKEKRSAFRIAGQVFAALLLVAVMGSASWFVVQNKERIVDYFWPPKTPEWFAARFTELSSQLSSLHAVGDEATQQKHKIQDEAIDLKKLWVEAIKDELHKDRFVRADRIVAAATGEVELISADTVSEQWKLVEQAWEKSEREGIKGQGFASAAAAIAEFQPEAVFPGDGYDNFACRDKVIGWQKELCLQESNCLASAIDKALRDTSGISPLIKMADEIQAIPSLSEATKVAFRGQVKTLLVERLIELTEPEKYDFAEALRQLKRIPSTILSEVEKTEIENRLLEALASRVKSLVQSKKDGAQAADLLGKCGDTVDESFRTKLGQDLHPYWYDSIAKAVDEGSLELAAQQLDKFRFLAIELHDAPSWNPLHDQIKTAATARLEKLTEPEGYNFAEALRQLKLIPSTIFSEVDKTEVKNRLLNLLNNCLCRLIESTNDGNQAATILVRCGELAEQHDRIELGHNLYPVWSAPIEKAISEGSWAHAEQQLEKFRALANELCDMASWNKLKAKIVSPPVETPPIEPPPRKDIPNLVRQLIEEARKAYMKDKWREASQSLASAADRLKNKDEPELSRQVSNWQDAVTISDSAGKADLQYKAVRNVETFLGSPVALTNDKTDEVSALALAYARYLMRSPSLVTEKQIQLALKGIRLARRINPLIQIKADSEGIWAALWERRIENLIQADHLPQEIKEPFDEIKDDWPKIKLLPVNPSRLVFINAWRAECIKLFELGTRKDLKSDLAQLSSHTEPYIQYVCFLIGAYDNSDVQSKVDGLKALLSRAAATDSKSREHFLTPLRIKRLIEWVADSVDSVRNQNAAPGLLANPFGNDASATTCYDLLTELGNALKATQATDQLSAKLRVERAASAIFKTLPDLDSARIATKKWFEKVEDFPSSPDWRQMALYSAVYSRSDPAIVKQLSRAEVGNLLRCSTLLINALAEDVRQNNGGRIEEESATRVYGRFLCPVLKTSGSLVNKPPAEIRGDLASFYSAAYYFFFENVSDWTVLKLSNPDLNTLIGDLLDSAISLNDSPHASEALRQLFRQRARRRLEANSPNLDGAILDARRAGDPELEAKAYNQRAPAQDQRKLIVQDVNAAITLINGVKAPTAEGLDILSQAYIYRANYSTDYSDELRTKDLDEAAKSIQQAGERFRQGNGKSETGFNEYEYHMAAGNAYEDLAWLVEKDDPVTNMNTAIIEFGRAAQCKESEAQPFCSIGRCYFKALTESCLAESYLVKSYHAERNLPNTQLKNLDGRTIQNESDAMDACEDALRKSLAIDGDLVEANAILGWLYKRRASCYFTKWIKDNVEQEKDSAFKEYEKAEEQVKATWTLAEKKMLPTRAYYVVSWVKYPLDDYRIVPAKRVEKVRERLHLLRDKVQVGTPPGNPQYSSKEEALIFGRIAEIENRESDALSIYDKELTGTASGADCELYTERAILHWLRAQNALKKATPGSVDLIASRTEARDEDQKAISDAQEAEKLAFFMSQKVTAQDLVVKGMSDISHTTESIDEMNRMLPRLIKEVSKLQIMAPRRPLQSACCEQLAKLYAGPNNGIDASANPADRLKDFSASMHYARLTLASCQSAELKTTRGELQKNVKRANDYVKGLLNTPPAGLAVTEGELKKLLEEWKDVTDKVDFHP